MHGFRTSAVSLQLRPVMASFLCEVFTSDSTFAHFWFIIAHWRDSPLIFGEKQGSSLVSCCRVHHHRTTRSAFSAFVDAWIDTFRQTLLSGMDEQLGEMPALKKKVPLFMFNHLYIYMYIADFVITKLLFLRIFQVIKKKPKGFPNCQRA